MFSQTGEYALRIMVTLASSENAVTIPQLAVTTRVPEGYLAKVLRSLSRAGLIRSRRGLHGGSVLARPARKICLHDVLQAVDPIERIHACPLKLRAHGSNLCALHHKMDEAIAKVEQMCRDCTLADLLMPDGSGRPLCGDAGALRGRKPRQVAQ